MSRKYPAEIGGQIGHNKEMDNGRMAVDPKFEDPVVRLRVMDVIKTVLGRR